MKIEPSLQKYAELAVRVGINLKEKEGLIISTNIHGLELARAVLAKAYLAGAIHVEILFNDDRMTRSRYQNARPYVFESYPGWKVDTLRNMYEGHYHHLFIKAPDPELLSDIPEDLIALDYKNASEATAVLMPYRMTGKTKWCILAVPSPAWASKVFPEMETSDAIKALWDKIFYATRISEPDPINAWKVHDLQLKKYRDFLNEQRFRRLVFKSAKTDAEVYLADSHYWMGGSKNSLAGDPFVANIPTEEVFTTPHRLKVNGKIHATKPLCLNGKIVFDFGFTFKDGAVVDYFAGKGKEALEYFLSNDPGARYLGEVALVPDDSPISNTGILFNNTLFDENASVHFALGRAYPYAMQNGTELSEEELEKRGANFSLVHTDFMAGSPDMNITAYDDKDIPTHLFVDGNWAF
jgi:aminopeptidase